MDLFTVIDDGVAIIRAKKGILKQVGLYARGGRVYVPVSGGFVRVCASLGGEFVTSHPDIKVVEMEAPGLDVSKSEPRFNAPLKAAA